MSSAIDCTEPSLVYFLVQKIDAQKEDAANKWHYVYGGVYSPLEIDSDGETMTADDVKKMAHEFISSGLVGQIDIMHDKRASGAKVVESYIAKTGDPDGYPEGTWVLGVRVPEGDLWNAIKSGKLNGYSFHAAVSKVTRKVLVDIAKIAVGTTEVNTDDEVIPQHAHDFYLEFDSNGQITVGTTQAVMKHWHKIAGTVVTEEELGHTHRFAV